MVKRINFPGNDESDDDIFEFFEPIYDAWWYGGGRTRYYPDDERLRREE